MQRILGYARRAAADYEMIKAGDKIAVGVSGGKDSLGLLCAMARLRLFYPAPFEVEAITVDAGYGEMDFSGVARLCEGLGVRYTVRKTPIKDALETRREKNPCSLCANLRRGALNSAALEIGCNKVALAHHNDDVIETFFLSLFFEGRLNCFSPVTYLDRKKITVIRPMIYAPESAMRGAAEKLGLPTVHNPCPANGHTQRQYIKELIAGLERQNPGFKARLFTAVRSMSKLGWR